MSSSKFISLVSIFSSNTIFSMSNSKSWKTKRKCIWPSWLLLQSTVKKDWPFLHFYPIVKRKRRIHRRNPDSLRSCFCFRIFPLNFASDFFNLLLARFHQVKIIIVKYFIRGRNNEAWVGVEPSTLFCLENSIQRSAEIKQEHYKTQQHTLKMVSTAELELHKTNLEMKKLIIKSAN